MAPRVLLTVWLLKIESLYHVFIVCFFFPTELFFDLQWGIPDELGVISRLERDNRNHLRDFPPSPPFYRRLNQGLESRYKLARFQSRDSRGREKFRSSESQTSILSPNFYLVTSLETPRLLSNLNYLKGTISLFLISVHSILMHNFSIFLSISWYIHKNLNVSMILFQHPLLYHYSQFLTERQPKGKEGFSSVQYSSVSVMSDSLWTHGLQHTRFHCPSPTPGACSNSCPSSQWCHPTIILCCPLHLLYSIFPSLRVFSSESVLRIRWPNVGVSASASVLPMNIQNWFPLGWTGWIFLQSKRLSRVFSNTTVQEHQFFGAEISL